METPENSPGISDDSELCGFTWDVGIEGEFEVECGLPRAHEQNGSWHEATLSFDRPPDPIGPRYYTPAQLAERERWLELWGPMLKRTLTATPLPRFSNTSERTSGEDLVRFAVHSMTTNSQAPATPNTTSSASPATHTETQ